MLYRQMVDQQRLFSNIEWLTSNNPKKGSQFKFMKKVLSGRDFFEIESSWACSWKTCLGLDKLPPLILLICPAYRTLPLLLIYIENTKKLNLCSFTLQWSSEYRTGLVFQWSEISSFSWCLSGAIILNILYISTSKWVLRRPYLGQNQIFDAITTFSLTNGRK